MPQSQELKNYMARVRRAALRDRELEAIYIAKQHGEAVKQAVLRDIRSHPFSIDLISHNQHSAYLSGRKGSLFGFLGFIAGTNPVEELVKFLNEFWIVRPEKVRTAFGFRIKVKLPLPTKADMKKYGLVLIWQQSLAWPYFVENPISNLPYFLSKIGYGYSKEGFQAEKIIYDAQFNGVDYITGIFLKNRPLLRAKKFRI